MPSYTSGRVHEVLRGSAELEEVLSAAATHHFAVLVDYSAAWCGPCRALAPLLDALATEHRGRLAVLKVDCEATVGNQRLAREAGVSAFPTLHFYSRSVKIGTIRGANPPAIRAKVLEALAQLPQGRVLGGGGEGNLSLTHDPSPYAASPPSPASLAAVASPRPNMARDLAAALSAVKAAAGSPAEFEAAARTVLTFVDNVLSSPGDAKFRRIRESNARFQASLGRHRGGKACLLAVGFQERREGGQAWLLMEALPRELEQVRGLLHAAMRLGKLGGAEAGQGGSAGASEAPVAVFDSAPASATASATVSHAASHTATPPPTPVEGTPPRPAPADAAPDGDRASPAMLARCLARMLQDGLAEPEA